MFNKKKLPFTRENEVLEFQGNMQMWNVLLDNSCLIELLASASNIWDCCLGHKSCEHQTL